MWPPRSRRRWLTSRSPRSWAWPSARAWTPSCSAGGWRPTRACGPGWPPRRPTWGSACWSPRPRCAPTTGPWWPARAASPWSGASTPPWTSPPTPISRSSPASAAAPPAGPSAALGTRERGRRAPGVLAGLGGCRRRLPSGSHDPVPTAVHGGSGDNGGAADQPADQGEEGDGDQADVAAGSGRDGLGSGDGGHGHEVALAGPGLLHRGPGALGLGGLDAAEQPVVLVLGRRHGRGGLVVVELRLVERPALGVDVLGGPGDGGGGGDQRQAQRQGGERPVGAAHDNLLL